MLWILQTYSSYQVAGEEDIQGRASILENILLRGIACIEGKVAALD